MRCENMAKNRPKCCQIVEIFYCDNLWKSVIMAPENSGNFFLLLCGHPVVDCLLLKLSF